MKHLFQHRCYDANKLLEGCNKLSTFMNRVNKQAAEDRGMGWTSDEYKGMAFEALIEVLICASPIDKRIDIKDYRPHSSKLDGQDMGIDGFGFSHNGNLHTIQIKFRNDVMSELNTKDMISNFVAKTTSSPVYKDADMTLFTTAKGLGQKIAEDMYHGRVRTLGHKELSKLIDGNQAFWDLFRTEMNCQ
jgi:hypothetical protein